MPPSRNTTPPRLPTSGIRSSVEKFIVVCPPIGSPDPLSGETSNRPQPRRLVAPPRKYRLKNGTGGFQSWAQAIDRAAARTKGEHGARAQRHVGAALERDLVVVVVAAQPPARLLEVHRGDVALARIEQITGGIAACVEEDRGPQPLRYAAVT